MTLGDRVAVMRDGVIEQVAPPMEVYRRPATLFVAGFVGSPAMNFLPQPDGTLLGVRPQDLAVVAPGAGDYQGIVDVVEPRGSEQLLYVRTGAVDAGRELRVIARPTSPSRRSRPSGSGSTPPAFTVSTPLRTAPGVAARITSDRAGGAYCHPEQGSARSARGECPPNNHRRAADVRRPAPHRSAKIWSRVPSPARWPPTDGQHDHRDVRS